MGLSWLCRLTTRYCIAGLVACQPAGITKGGHETPQQPQARMPAHERLWQAAWRRRESTAARAGHAGCTAKQAVSSMTRRTAMRMFPLYV